MLRSRPRPPGRLHLRLRRLRRSLRLSRAGVALRSRQWPLTRVSACQRGYLEESSSHGPLRCPANSFEPRWTTASQGKISAKHIVPLTQSVSGPGSARGKQSSFNGGHGSPIQTDQVIGAAALDLGTCSSGEGYEGALVEAAEFQVGSSQQLWSVSRRQHRFGANQLL
jgi:hypothetical protein